ncbi:MAG: hypothetical protein OXF75_13530 [Acidimicrobiaceae bacterium]|nr:hypothetical protein [Acidimicrobiaceae bacterium]
MWFAPRETEAALSLLRLEPNDSRRQFLSDAGPVHDPANPAASSGAYGLLRDLDDRVSAVHVGPIPEEDRRRFSTNIEDRRGREA